MEDCEDLVGEVIFVWDAVLSEGYAEVCTASTPCSAKGNQWKIELLWFPLFAMGFGQDQGFGRGENTLQPKSGAGSKISTRVEAHGFGRKLAPQTSVACWKNADGSE
mmetsp:Transcript_133495/g.426708  ORF Transcript_133495/g.426708 Transcript_133495/m.426708 type:complete len:107 (+) Transcript_133495:179-499(+)